jgi:chitinase
MSVMPVTRVAIALSLAAVVAGCSGTEEPLPGAASGVTVTVTPPAPQAQPAGTQQFTAAVTGTSVTSVTWSVQEGTAGGSVTAGGLYAAPATVGTYHVVVRSSADTTKFATATVTVTSAPQVAVQANPASTTVQAGATVQFTASVTGSTNGGVNWTVQETSTGGSVSSSGLYTAPSTAGTYHVVATSIADATKSSVATVVVTAAPAGGTKPWVSAYYAGWFWDNSVTKVDMTAMTHLIFGRVAPGGGSLGGAVGQVVLGAGSAHDKTQGPGAPTQSVEDYLVTKAHAAGIKAILMMGGVGDGPGWVASTANANIQATFISNTLDYLVAHNYDGIDVDWEDSLTTTAERTQLNNYLAALRAAANARPRYQSPHAPFIITFTGYALNTNSDLPVEQWRVTTASLVDQYNMMSYALSGSYPGWDTWYFCPIFGRSSTRPVDLDSSILGYGAAGIPASKIGIGIGFYGQNYAPQPTWAASKAYALNAYALKGISVYRASQAGTSGTTGPSGTGTAIVDGTVRWAYVGDMGPRQSLNTVGNLGVQNNDIEWSYKNILAKYIGHGTYFWDDAAKQGYLLFPDGYTPAGASRGGFLTYEDENSIAAKGAWVRSQGIGGAIIWVINYGITDATTGANPLLAATKAAFLQ